MRPLLICTALLCAVFLARAGELKVTLSDIEGEQRNVLLMELTPDGIRTDSGDVAYKDLSKIEFDAGSQNLSHDVVPMPSIHLRNGDILKASVKSGDDTKLTVNSKLLGEQQIAVVIDGHRPKGILVRNVKLPAVQNRAVRARDFFENRVRFAIGTGRDEHIGDRSGVEKISHIAVTCRVEIVIGINRQVFDPIE